MQRNREFSNAYQGIYLEKQGSLDRGSSKTGTSKLGVAAANSCTDSPRRSDVFRGKTDMGYRRLLRAGADDIELPVVHDLLDFDISHAAQALAGSTHTDRIRIRGGYG